MLEKIDLSLSMDKKEYNQQIKPLEEKLGALQLEIKRLKIPVIIMFEGWSSSGKGTAMSKVLYPLDPRYFNVYTMNRITEESYMRPYLWSYFTKTPEGGRITLLDKSWNRAMLPDGLDGWRLGELEKKNFYDDINAFEEQLTSDGNVIIKFFLHISKEEQKNRFNSLLGSEETKWRVDKKDLGQNKNYDKNLELFDYMIQKTSTAENPWHVIEANNYCYATFKIYNTLIEILESKIKQDEASKEAAKQEELPAASILSKVKPYLEADEYKKNLSKYQSRIKELGYKLYDKRRSVVIVFEGWDAAGKGGTIKRLTEELDPRGYEVIPVAAPTQEELSHHYLWRFWNKYPKDGHIAIFDRSWYGRVMVERIEGFCTAEEWQRAYKEINDMECHFYNHGTILFKFWLQIDRDEQLRRFTSRQQNPLKQHKITDEDWRNREKWDLYETAVNEMLLRTDTDYSPWTIVESNNKKHARIKVLKKVVEELEKSLK